MLETRVSRKIKYISFVLAIGVIYIHTYNVVVYGLDKDNSVPGRILNNIEFWISGSFSWLCVPFFFFLSGYLFFRNYGWNKVLEKYGSRIRTLLIPYLIWCSLYFGLYAVITRIPAIASKMNMDIVELTISNYVECLRTSQYTVLWFMVSLIRFVIVAPVFYLLLVQKKNKIWNLISEILFGALIVLMELHQWDVLPFALPFSAFLNEYFLVGGWLSIHAKRWMESNDKKKTIPAIIGSVPGLVLLRLYEDTVQGSILVVMLLICLWFAADIVHYTHEPAWWMQQTFFIYCAHSFLLEAMEKVCLVILGKNVAAAAFDYFLIPWIVLAIIIFVATVLYKFVPRIYRILTGGRG